MAVEPVQPACRQRFTQLGMHGGGQLGIARRRGRRCQFAGDARRILAFQTREQPVNAVIIGWRSDDRARLGPSALRDSHA